MFERRSRREHLVITECTEDFPVELLIELLGHVYKIESFILGPEMLGWWVTRRRRFCVLVLLLAFGGRIVLRQSVGDTVGTFKKVRPTDSEQADMFLLIHSKQALTAT